VIKRTVRNANCGSERTGKNIGMVVINGGLLNEMDAVGCLVPKSDVSAPITTTAVPKPLRLGA
jgi:hypothetical protein